MAKKPTNETPEERGSRLLTEARSVTPELPIADLTGFVPPPGAVGELRLRRSWGHALLVQDEAGVNFKLFRPKVEPEKPTKKGRKGAAVEPPPGETAPTPETEE